jgi:hypothetical protein
MPKDKIGHTETVSNMDGHDCHVEVQWARDEPRVVVFTRTEKPYILGEIAEPETAVSSGDSGSPEPSGETIDFHGFGCVLDHAGMNDLIATLKRARRMAFGGDGAPYGSATDGVFTPETYSEGDGISAQS